MKVSIVICAYNEEENCPDALTVSLHKPSAIGNFGSSMMVAQTALQNWCSNMQNKTIEFIFIRKKIKVSLQRENPA